MTDLTKISDEQLVAAYKILALLRIPGMDTFVVTTSPEDIIAETKRRFFDLDAEFQEEYKQEFQ